MSELVDYQQVDMGEERVRTASSRSSASSNSIASTKAPTAKARPARLKPTDSLVREEKRLPVPNHVLNTKIYKKLQRNEFFEASPAEIHFAGFDLDTKDLFKVLRLINVSGQLQRVTILPPDSKHFHLSYTKPERLVPGFAIEVKVFFKPDEYKYYTDSIKILSEGDENLIVPIHAYPILPSNDFLPSKYSFPSLPIGKSLTHSFRMRSSAAVEFEYLIDIVQNNPAFSIEPLEGIIPANKDTVVNVTYRPIDFSTAIFTIQLIVSQFNSQPIECTFYGTSKPGLERDMIYKSISQNNMKALTNDSHESDSTNKAAREIKPMRKTTNSTIPDPNAADPLVEYEGYRFPTNLNAPWNIARVLNQKKNKLSVKELKSTSIKNSIKLTAQAKEQLFLQKVAELEEEERKNQLKWQVKLGDTLIDAQAREEILKSRAQSEYEYQMSIGTPFRDIELQRQTTLEIDCKTIRSYDQLARDDVTFDTYKNQTWHVRYLAIERFVQAGRKVVVKQRLVKVLNLLKKFIGAWNESIRDAEQNDKAKLSLETFVEFERRNMSSTGGVMSRALSRQNDSVKGLSVKSIGSYYFPQVNEYRELQNQQARYCEKLSSITKLDSLGLVAVKSIDFQVPHKIAFVAPATPVHYKLNAYRALSDNNYVTRHETRLHNLRKGAHDELTNDTAPAAPSQTVVKIAALVETASTSSLAHVAQSSLSKTSETHTANTFVPETINPKPPDRLVQPANYPPLHIFNPVPAIVHYETLLPYAGTDLNYHLNPLPRFERDQYYPTQKKFLDREDVIKGLMTWKKFPSQGLVTLSSMPTLSDVWVPRLSSRFSEDIMPLELPELLEELPADDKKCLALEDDDTSDGAQSGINNRDKRPNLTVDSVAAQFNLPRVFEVQQEKMQRDESWFPFGDKLPANNLPVGALGQISRHQREAELDFFVKKQYNTFGLRILTKLHEVEKKLKSQVTDESLE